MYRTVWLNVIVLPPSYSLLLLRAKVVILSWIKIVSSKTFLIYTDVIIINHSIAVYINFENKIALVLYL